MEIRIVPIMVKEDGTVSVHIAPTDDPAKPGFISFSNPDVPGLPTLMNHLPEDFFANIQNLSAISVRVLPRQEGDPDKAYIVVSGKEAAFAPARLGETSRWVSQTDFKYGPLPQGVKDASSLQNLYTASMERENLGALLAGVYTVKAMGIQEEIPNNLPVVFQRIAENTQLTSVIMDPKTKLRTVMEPVLGPVPVINVTEPATKPFNYAVTRRTFGTIAAKITAFLGRAGSVQPDGLAARAAAEIKAAATRTAGATPKPA